MDLNVIKDMISNPTWSKGLHLVKSGPKLELLKEVNDLTSFLPLDSKAAQRAWHILNDDYTLKYCPQCNNKLLKWNGTLHQYNTFCSTRCSTLSPFTQDKMKSTNLERYGVENGMQSDIIRKRFEDSMQDKYGVSNALESETFMEKNKQTLMHKYGVDNPMKSDLFKEKLKTTYIEKYGVDNPTKHADTLDKIKTTVKEKYGTEYYYNSDDFKEKTLITNMEKYGVDHPMKNSNIVDKMKSTNISKYGVEYNSQIHIPAHVYELVTKEWLLEQHHTFKLPIYKIAESIDTSEQFISDRLKLYNIEVKYFRESMTEREIKNYLMEDLKLNVNKNKSIIHPYELDIYSNDHNIAIEYHGLYFHGELKLDDYINYHYKKYQLCKSKNIRLIQIFEDEWQAKSDIIKNKIKHIFNISNDAKVYARKTAIVQVDTKTKTKFFDDNHIQGNGPSSINYGLEYNGKLVSCIGFIENNDGSYNLNRYATSCNVVGGFTKLLSYFEKVFNNPKIITFADLRWSEGDLYYKTGFVMDKILKPDYYWCKNGVRRHKFNFRHTTGLKKLENYDPNLSESENMHNHGYFRIYDAGKLRFIKN